MTEQNGVGRSSATEILRRLLDERGVEWQGREDVHTDFTFWCGVHACETGPMPSLAVYHLTPEQAIAATLGRGTCHVKAAKKIGDSFGFSLSCGHSMVNPFNDHPDYCPWCGAKVVDE